MSTQICSACAIRANEINSVEAPVTRYPAGRVKEKGGRRSSWKCRLRWAGETIAYPDKHLSTKVISQSWRLSVDTLAFV